jgi:acetolactate synthase small subunit
VQTRFVLEAMANKENEDGDRWDRMMAKIDRLTEKVVGVEEVQQKLMMQSELAAAVAQKAAEERVHLAQQVEKTGREVAEIRLEWMARNMEGSESVMEE